LLGIPDAPKHDEVNIDDVLIAAQHQALLADIADGSADAARAGARAHADFNDVLLRYLGQAYFINRIGHAKVQAGGLLAGDFAEAHHDAQLIGVHTKAEGIIANNGCKDGSHKESDRAGQAGSARHRLSKLVSAAPEEVFDFRPRGRFGALATATVIPGHEAHLPCSPVMAL
jgi:hypothetical protein